MKLRPLLNKFGFDWNDLVDADCLRYWRWKCPYFGIRLHHWHKGDNPGYNHDHAWSFITLVLKGGYTDVSYQAVGFTGNIIQEISREPLRAGAVRRRPAEHRHSVVDISPGGCWSVVLMGRERRAGTAYWFNHVVDWHSWLKDVCS